MKKLIVITMLILTAQMARASDVDDYILEDLTSIESMQVTVKPVKAEDSADQIEVSNKVTSLSSY